MRSAHQIVQLTVIMSVILIATMTSVAQAQIRRLPPTQVAVDENVLSEFTNAPGDYFELAQSRFVAGDRQQAARHMRTASAFLRLEAARASVDAKAALEASNQELQRLALAVEKSQIRSEETLQQAFARAHYALAGHHCTMCAGRCGCGMTADDKCCCKPVTTPKPKELIRAGQDLNAAAIHLQRGATWAGEELDEATRAALAASQITAEKLIQQEATSQNDIQRAIHSLHGNLEGLTGRKIMLARPMTEDDQLGPSLFR